MSLPGWKCMDLHSGEKKHHGSLSGCLFARVIQEGKWPFLQLMNAHQDLVIIKLGVSWQNGGAPNLTPTLPPQVLIIFRVCWAQTHHFRKPATWWFFVSHLLPRQWVLLFEEAIFAPQNIPKPWENMEGLGGPPFETSFYSPFVGFEGPW